MIGCLYNAGTSQPYPIPGLGSLPIPGWAICTVKCIEFPFHTPAIPGIPAHSSGIPGVPDIPAVPGIPSKTINVGGGDCNSVVMDLAKCAVDNGPACVADTTEDFFSQTYTSLKQSYLDDGGYTTSGTVTQTNDGMSMSGAAVITKQDSTVAARRLGSNETVVLARRLDEKPHEGKDRSATTNFWVSS
jgi:hypothetical protein